MQKYLPLFLTLFRLGSSLFLPFLILLVEYYNNFYFNLIVSILFVIISLTDFLDGFFARKYNLESNLGKILDPIADKILVLSSLITFVYLNKIYFYFVFLIFLREFVITSLREIALSYNFYLEVILSAKIKTFVQLLFIIYNILDLNKFYNIYLTIFLGKFLLFLSLFFSFYSMFYYFIIFHRKFKLL